MAIKWSGILAISAAIQQFYHTQAETSGHLYVSDLDVHAVHRFSHSGQYLGEFVKRRSGGLDRPAALRFWAADAETDPENPSMLEGQVGRRHLYVASAGSQAVLQYDGTTGRFVRQLCPIDGRPHGLAFHAGVLYVSDKLSNQISRFRASSGSPLGVFAQGGAFSLLDGPWHIHFVENVLLAASHHNQKLLSFAPDQLNKCPLEQSPCSSPPTVLSADTIGPISMFAVGGDSIYTCEPSGSVTRLNATTGQFIDQWNWQLKQSFGCAYSRGHLFVTNAAGSIHRYDGRTGESYGTWSSPYLSFPNFLLWD